MSFKIQVAPSLLAADFSKLDQEISRVCEAGADMLHVDVMDGHFVPNITMGPCVIEGIKKLSSVPLDVHLMIENPQQHLLSFVKAGSDWLTFHIEAVSDPQSILAEAKSLGVKVGMSVRPKTDVDVLADILPLLDLVLVMSVEPGFGGQQFQPPALDKVRRLRQHHQFAQHISIDGGINLTTASLAVEAGVDILAVGSAIFAAPSPQSTILQLKTLVRKK